MFGCNKSRRTFVVVDIVECLLYSPTVSFTTGKGVDTETCGMDDLFPPDDL